MVRNRSLVFTQVPEGTPIPGQHLLIAESSLDLEAPLPTGGFLIKNQYASFDPYMRQIMEPPKNGEPASLSQGVIFEGPVIAVVLRADGSENFQPGEMVTGWSPFQEFTVVTSEASQTFKRLENHYNLHPTAFLGALGTPGLTGYCAFYDLGQPKKGETILISAACGSVGQMVGQLAKREGLRVLGVVGGREKLKIIVDELSFDGGIDYKTDALEEKLAQLAPNGIDIYFDNVGGRVLEVALEAMRVDGRIVACGFASQYNIEPSQRYGIRNTNHIVAKRLTWHGLNIDLPGSFLDKYRQEHKLNIQQWIKDGSFKSIVSTTYGIENAAHGMAALFRGENVGKAVLDMTSRR